MVLNASNRNGGCKTDYTGIIIAWKMKKDAGIGCLDPGIMMRRELINGLFMDFLHKAVSRKDAKVRKGAMHLATLRLLCGFA